MKILYIKIGKHWHLFVDRFGNSFSGGFVIFPTVVINFQNKYYQFTFCWLNFNYDFTFTRK